MAPTLALVVADTQHDSAVTELDRAITAASAQLGYDVDGPWHD